MAKIKVVLKIARWWQNKKAKGLLD